jgi:phage terminase large subunit-like protein
VVRNYKSLENEQPERFERSVQSWDTANEATELSDFSVCTTWGVTCDVSGDIV